MNDKRKYKILRVTITQDYIVEMCDNQRSKLDGRTIPELIEEWFIKHPVGSYHATRDACKIGNSGEFLNVEVVDV